MGFGAWFKIKLMVPVWFDEGLAMQVNFDKIYSFDDQKDYVKENNKELDKVKSLVTYSQFLSDKNKIWFNYFAAKYEVNEWLKKVDKQGFLEFITRLSNFENFEKNYNSYL
jgi:hypothetical protein